MRVERLHVIVHPGFIAETEDQTIKRGGKPTGAAEAMRERYSHLMGTMLPEELAIGMLHIEPKMLNRIPKRSLYFELIQEFRDRLGKRFIMTDQSKSVTDDSWIQEQFENAKATARRNGFTFNASTPTVACGETLFCCVPNCAERVNISGHFKAKTIIQADHCDVEVPLGTGMEEALAEIPSLERRYPHTRIVFEKTEA